MEESPERLARPLVRLASMMGVATSYTGLSRDFHEISDETLIAILGALGIDATTPEAIEQAIIAITREQNLRLVDPTVLHTVGKETHVTLRTGITEPAQITLILENGEPFEGELQLNPMPEAKVRLHTVGKETHVTLRTGITEPAQITLILENGEPFEGELQLNPMPEAKVREIDGKFVAESDLVLPADLPVGYHTLHVESGDHTENATLISAPERIEMLDPMKDGSLWGRGERRPHRERHADQRAGAHRDARPDEGRVAVGLDGPAVLDPFG